MNYWATFSELIVTPFKQTDLIFGIVPLYFGLLLNEMTSAKASFRTAVQTGFSFIWASAQWLYPYFKSQENRLDWSAMPPINLLVTILVILFGITALISGLRRRYPRYGRFLGFTRFSNYFMIMIFPIQAHELLWTWERLIVIALFAVPIWLMLHFGLMPVRNRK